MIQDDILRTVLVRGRDLEVITRFFRDVHGGYRQRGGFPFEHRLLTRLERGRPRVIGTRFFLATTRKQDQAGSLVEDAGNCQELSELPELTTTLSTDDQTPPCSFVPVPLSVVFTETGTMQVWRKMAKPPPTRTRTSGGLSSR